VKHSAKSTILPVILYTNRMEQGGLERKDLEEFIGPKGRVSEILNGRRQLTLDMIEKLHKGLGIPLQSLVFGAENTESASNNGSRNTDHSKPLHR